MNGIGKSSEFVDLDRRFEKVEQFDSSEDSALHSYTTEALFGNETGLKWDQLLENHLVVVLGEPGSGKTWEFRERAKILRIAGESAFYIRLDQLISQSLEEALGRDEYGVLKSWLRKESPAFFLLDSVDEAKFRRPTEFYDAIEKFAKALGPKGLMGAKVFLSSRISEWQPASDAREVLTRLRVPLEVAIQYRTRWLPAVPPGSFYLNQRANSYINRIKAQQSDPKNQLLLVCLQPLDRNRVEKLARVLQVKEATAYIEALDNHHAWEFARRPIDVVGLVEFWRANGRLGSLSEMVEFDVGLKLRPADRDRNDPLSAEKAREGAETLGAANAFCRQFNFKVPDDALIDTGGIDPSSCLPATWRKEQVVALLTRAIFDSATFGQFRFHHRRVSEYLAAKWITERMRQGCPKPELERLLFDTVSGERVIRPSLAAVTAWLCGGGEPWNNDVRSWVLEGAPEIHLRFGDPEALPIDYRKKLLQALVDRSAGRQHLWIETSAAALDRLADPQLAAEIAAVISDSLVSQDLRSEMIQVVRFGRLKECLVPLLNLIESPGEIDALKSYAAAAIRDAGDDAARRRLVDIALALPRLSNHLCGLVFEAAFPGAMTTRELVTLLNRIENAGRHIGDIPYHLNHHFRSALTPECSRELLEVLVALARSEPLITNPSGLIGISERFSWLGEVILPVVIFVLAKSQLTDREVETTSEALCLLGAFRACCDLHDESLVEINPQTARHSEVREACFWKLVNHFREAHGEEPQSQVDVFDHCEVLRIVPEDFDWLVEAIQSRQDPRDQKVALNFAFGIGWGTSSWYTKRKRIRRYVRSDESLYSRYRDLVSSYRFLGLRRWWHQHIKYKIGQRWWWIRKARWWMNVRYWLRSQWILLTHLRKLASGDTTEWLSELSREADKNQNHRWAPDSWEGLRKKRGGIVMRAAKMGCKRAWRKFNPLLPHEELNPNQTDLRVVVGLSGLQAAAMDGDLDFLSLTQDEALRAARYGVNELNGFAPWFPELALLRADAVKDVLCECIEGEWSFPPEREHVHEVLSKLVWQGDYLRPLVDERIWILFWRGDPPNSRIHEFAVALLMKSERIPKGEVALLAKGRLREYRADSAAFLLWMNVLLQVDGERALDALDESLQSAEGADALMVRICASLGGRLSDNVTLVPNPSYREPATLRRFIPMIYRHVRPAEDIHHEGGYSPVARDDAQEFRGGVLNLLAKSESPEAVECLRSLMDEALLVDRRDWIAHLIEEWRRREGDLAPWHAADVRAFAIEHEGEPKTDRELFGIARKRLQELKLDVEKAENSLRRELHPDYDEADLRKWLHRKLYERARGRYNVPEEVEIDLEQRPDLRMENPKTDPVSIEVKWAEKWTVSQMLERLETQLIGQYLRAHNARYGIYVLGVIDPTRKHWENPTDGRRLQFEDLVNLIRDRARDLSGSRSDVDEVEVFGIDFRNPRR